MTLKINKSIFWSTISIILFLTCANIKNVNSVRVDYGEACNQTVRCNRTSWLTCQDGFCGCTKRDEMIFDINQQKCVSKAGERCKFEVDESSSDGSSATIFKLYEKANCVSNSVCDVNGVCTCQPNFYEFFNGSCLAKGDYKAQCSSNEQCRVDKFLTCNEGFCTCSSESRYHFEYGQCVGLPARSCLNKKCTDFAECSDLTNTCQCTPENNFYQDFEGHCRSKKGQFDSCKEDYECKYENMFLSCVNGSCNCPSSKYLRNVNYTVEEINPNYNGDYCRSSKYNSNYKRYCHKNIEKFRDECVGRANQQCNSNNNCVENALCTNGICTCDAEFSATSSGLCGYGYGQTCDLYSKICSDTFTCNEGKCACKHPKHQLNYNCLSRVFGPCSDDSNCIDNTYCKISLTSGNGICYCKPGFIENEEGSCDLAFGSQCRYDVNPYCDRIGSLQCVDGICTCPDQSFTFNTNLSICLGLVGSRCLANDEEPICVENAKCMRTRNRGKPFGKCECIKGFEETASRECVPEGTAIRTSTNHTMRSTTVTIQPYLLTSSATLAEVNLSLQGRSAENTEAENNYSNGCDNSEEDGEC